MTPDRLDLASSLNPEQFAAVTHKDGPLLVVAGAGSGKTRVITHRIAWLVGEVGVEPWRIAAVTFTNKAADEMRTRVHDLVGEDANVFVGTFHRFCVRLLRRYGERVGLRRDFAILDGQDQLKLIKAALQAEHLDDKTFRPRSVQGRISKAKNELLTVADFMKQAEDFFDRHTALVFRRYQTALREAAAVDFDDLIAHSVRLLGEDEEIGSRVRGRFRHLLVDEFQDTNAAQMKLVENLVLGPDGSVSGLTVVGDEDQSIYGWRGAEVENVLRFEARFPGATARKLERNYRSTQNILDASGAVIARNENRRGKALWTDRGAGEKLRLHYAGDQEDEARWVVDEVKRLRTDGFAFGDIAVLVRTNAQTRALEDQMLRHEVPYCLVAGVRFYERAEVRDLVAYLRVIANPRDNLSLQRILNQPRRGIGGRSRQVIGERAAEMGHSWWDAIRLDPLQEMAMRSRRAVAGFRGLIDGLREQAERQPLVELVRGTIVAAGFDKLYDKGDEEGEERLANLQELVSAAHDFETQHALGAIPARAPGAGRAAAAAPRQASPADAERTLFEGQGDAADQEDDEPALNPLLQFLDYVALVSDVDGLNADLGVSLMTLHSAKGLEYPAVFLTGLEDGLLPHFHASDGASAIEEERRLLYVGMTRAERRLLLSVCRRRMIAGQFQDQQPSPFLLDLPEELVETTRSEDLFRRPRTALVHSFFGADRSRRAGFRAPSSPAAHRAPAAQKPTTGPAGVLRPGALVRHATLGKGVVLQLEGTGADARITVFFDQAGKRKLVKSYARLDVL